MSKRNKILYLSYSGMLEPLGRSQVLSYLCRLSDEYLFTLVSFEKPQDLADKNAVEDLHRECTRHEITWQPRDYHHRPRLLATAWDLLVLLGLTLWLSARREVCLVHCRSYIPAIAGWICGKITRKPFLFDMRALWPDEMATAGRLSKNSLIYKALKWFERRLLHDAAKAVSLTEAAADHLLEVYPEVPRDRFEVITTCVDISRFSVPVKPSSQSQVNNRDPFVVGTMGTLLSGWFYLDYFFEFFKTLKTHRPNAVMSIVTRDDHSVVMARASASGIEPSDIQIAAATPSEMPDYLAKMDLGVMFYAPDLGRAPTRLGEFLAAGVPVVGNRGIGDLALLIEQYGVGMVIDNVRDPQECDELARGMLETYDDIVDSQRCRAAAEDYFSADKGAERYRAIYRELEQHQSYASLRSK